APIRAVAIMPLLNNSFSSGTTRMWCDKCQADVAGMTSPDNERLFCASCGNELARPAGSVAQANAASAAAERALRDPRELLARWAREDSLEPLDIAAPAARQSTEP